MAFEAPTLEMTDEDLGGGRHVIAVRGEIHLTTAPELSARLKEAIAAGARGVVVDLTEVALIDSTGLSVLLNVLRRLTRAHGHLALVLDNPTVLRLFEITRLDSTFDIHATRAAALERVAQEAGGSSDGAP